MSTDAIRNLLRIKPYLKPGGGWDACVYINPTGFQRDPKGEWDQFEYARQIASLAQAEGILVCQVAEHLATAPANTLFLAGHGFGIGKPGVQQDLYNLGTALRGRSILLNTCSTPDNPGYRHDVHELIARCQPAEIFAYHDEISLLGVFWVLEEWIAIAKAQPGILPVPGMRQAINAMLKKHGLQKAANPSKKQV